MSLSCTTLIMGSWGRPLVRGFMEENPRSRGFMEENPRSRPWRVDVAWGFQFSKGI